MITIAELFPTYSTAHRWMTVFKRHPLNMTNDAEGVRLVKEYTVHTTNIQSKQYEGYDYKEEYRLGNFLHRIDGPALTTFINHKKNIECWYLRGIQHRDDDQPSMIRYFDNGLLHSKTWYKNQQIHRDNGPAYILYHCNGTICLETWYKNGIAHNEFGPAKIVYNDDGSVKTRDYYLCGNRVNFSDLQDYIGFRE